MSTKPTKDNPHKKHRKQRVRKRSCPIRKVLVLPVIVGLGIALFHMSGGSEFATLENLNLQRHWVLRQVDQYPFIMIAAFIFIYVMSVALSLPIGTLLTILGGYMFGQFLGTVYVVTSATVGACIVFSLAKTALGVSLSARVKSKIKIMEPGFRNNALYYMLFLRLVPIFPFFIINIVPAFLGVSLKTYLLGTFFGIIPSTFIFVTAGASLGFIFSSGDTLVMDEILTPNSIITLCGIALITILPILYKQLKTPSSKSNKNLQ